MLRTDLIELINQGRMWAFVGSGASTDAGCPSWGNLVKGTVAHMDEATRQDIGNDNPYQKAFSKEQFAKCFSRIEKFANRKAMEGAVAAQLASLKKPGNIIRRLVNCRVSKNGLSG